MSGSKFVFFCTLTVDIEQGEGSSVEGAHPSAVRERDLHLFKVKGLRQLVHSTGKRMMVAMGWSPLCELEVKLQVEMTQNGRRSSMNRHY